MELWYVDLDGNLRYRYCDSIPQAETFLSQNDFQEASLQVADREEANLRYPLAC